MGEHSFKSIYYQVLWSSMGEGDFCIKRTEMHVKNVKKNPNEILLSCFVWVVWNYFFSPLRGISSNATHIFLVQYSKNSTQTLAVDNLRPKTGYKTCFCNPSKVWWAAKPFCTWESPRRFSKTIICYQRWNPFHSCLRFIFSLL